MCQCGRGQEIQRSSLVHYATESFCDFEKHFEEKVKLAGQIKLSLTVGKALTNENYNNYVSLHQYCLSDAAQSLSIWHMLLNLSEYQYRRKMPLVIHIILHFFS